MIRNSLGKWTERYRCYPFRPAFFGHGGLGTEERPLQNTLRCPFVDRL